MLNMWYGAVGGDDLAPHRRPAVHHGAAHGVPRECLRDIGGVACAEGQLVDDMSIGRCVAAKGWRNVMAPHPLHIATGGMSYREFLQLFRRWMLFSRNGLPFEFTRPMWLRGVEFWVATAALGAGAGDAPLAGGAGAGGGAGGVRGRACCSSTSSSAARRCAGSTCGCRSPCRWWRRSQLGYGLVNKRVDWRGRAYDLDAHARLA